MCRKRTFATWRVRKVRSLTETPVRVSRVRRYSPSGRRASSSSPSSTTRAARAGERRDRGLAAACFRARLAGEPSPAAERTARVLARLPPAGRRPRPRASAPGPEPRRDPRHLPPATPNRPRPRVHPRRARARSDRRPCREPSRRATMEASPSHERTDMNNNPTPYPLAWPTGWPRTRAGDRERSRFRNARAVDDQLSMTDATSRLIRECRLLGAANVIVSTNVAVRRDGLPYARQRTPEDPGAAVYFKLESVPEGLVLACDRWLRVEDNIAAIAAHIGALRGIDRWGRGLCPPSVRGIQAAQRGRCPYALVGSPGNRPPSAGGRREESLQGARQAAPPRPGDRQPGTIPGHQQCVEGVPENAGVVNGSSARPGEPTTPPGAPTSPGAWHRTTSTAMKTVADRRAHPPLPAEPARVRRPCRRRVQAKTPVRAVRDTRVLDPRPPRGLASRSTAKTR